MLAAACGSDAPAASVSGVFPASGFAGRQVRVEVTGDVTNFAAGSTLDFGAGVTVGTVSVASPTSLFAEITIADTAVLGMRDVNVTSGADHYTLTQAFEIDTPLVVETSGTFSQGSVANLTIRNLDFSSPFDSTCGFSFFGQCFLYSNIEITLGTGTNVQVSFVDDYHISAQAFIDIDATGGPLSIASGAMTSITTSSLGVDMPIAARTPVALTTTAQSGAISTPGGSVLASFTTTAGTVGRAIAATDPATTSTVYLLPASGHFADQIARVDTADAAGNLQANGLAAGGGSFIAIYVDDGFMSPVTLKLSPLTLTTTLVENDTGGGNNTSGTAQVTTLPLLFNTATLSAETDQDWIRISAVAGDVGKHIHVVTAGGDPQTDTVVDAFTANGTTSLGESGDGTFHEDFVSDPIAAAGNIFIEISASQGFFKPAHNTYIAAVWIE